MRAVDCPCGEHFEARNDAELFESAKAHASSAHGDQYSDSDIRILVDTAAYDSGAPSAQTE